MRRSLNGKLSSFASCCFKICVVYIFPVGSTLTAAIKWTMYYVYGGERDSIDTKELPGKVRILADNGEGIAGELLPFQLLSAFDTTYK